MQVSRIAAGKGMRIPRDSFLVRPQRAFGESLVGYLNRFHWENGLTVPTEFNTTVRDLYHGGAARLEALAYTLGPTSLVARDEWFTKTGSVPPMIHGRPEWLKRAYYPIRYCPVCLRSKGFHADLWTLPIVGACPEHHTGLLSRCTVCGAFLAWGSLKPNWRCRCGAPLGDADSPRSTPWAIQLATEISRVSGLGVSDEMAVLSNAKPVQEIYQLYEGLALANRIRWRLKRRDPYQPEPHWPREARTSYSSTVGLWETRLLLADDRVRERFIHHLLCWKHRKESGVLVTHQEGGPLAFALDGLKKSCGNTYSAEFHSSLVRLLGQSRIDIPGLRDVFLHPRLSDEDLRSRLKRLSGWWHGLAQGIPVLRPVDALRQGVMDWGRRSEVLETLNILLAASFRNDDVARYSKLRARWQLPADLRRGLTPDQILPELARYFGQLRFSELMFVMDLLRDVEGR